MLELNMNEDIGLRIVCAANKYSNNVVVLGIRHLDQCMHTTIKEYTKLELINLNDKPIQGFVDNRNTFHTREEAWMIADAANQIIRRVGGDHKKLFSENMY